MFLSAFISCHIKSSSMLCVAACLGRSDIALLVMQESIYIAQAKGSVTYCISMLVCEIPRRSEL